MRTNFWNPLYLHSQEKNVVTNLERHHRVIENNHPYLPILSSQRFFTKESHLHSFPVINVRNPKNSKLVILLWWVYGHFNNVVFHFNFSVRVEFVYIQPGIFTFDSCLKMRLLYPKFDVFKPSIALAVESTILHLKCYFPVWLIITIYSWNKCTLL